MRHLLLKLGALVVGSGLLFACSCPAPQVAEKAGAKPVEAKPAPQPIVEPDCCKKLENELKALKAQVESLKSQLDTVKVEAKEAKEASQKAIEAANKATEAANRAEAAAAKAETSAAKAERVFEKGLKK
ncbi:MAG: alanine-zipper protein [Caldimicrobium sp.]